MGKKRKGHKSHHPFKMHKNAEVDLSDFGSKLKSAIKAKDKKQKGTENQEKNNIESHFGKDRKPEVEAKDIEDYFLSKEDNDSAGKDEKLKPSKLKRTVYISGQYWHKTPKKSQKLAFSPKCNESHKITSQKPTSKKHIIEKELEQKPKNEWHEINTKPSITINPQIDKIVPEQKRTSSENKPKAIHWQENQFNYKEERDIVIGFDFGTSCSKIILQDKQVKRAFAVPFDSVSSNYNRYLLATKIYLNSDGTLTLDKGAHEVSNLKALFISNPDEILFKSQLGESATSAEIAAAYIGLVLIEVRTWFFNIKSQDYKKVKINWELNIGLSSRSYDDRELYESIKLAALSGWNLSLYKHRECHPG